MIERLRMMRPRFTLARKKARELLAMGKIESAPIPVEQLAKDAGAMIRYEPFAGELSGMVHRSPTGVTIGVNSMHALTRRRFTVAHELGHLLLHRNEDLHVDERFPIGFRSELSSKAVDAAEIEANQFAAELLMPERFVKADVAALPGDLDIESAISRLAQRYEVSEQAMTIRLSVLGLLR
jgi:Zn-dependent peptidase ImmA (M78 family)